MWTRYRTRFGTALGLLLLSALPHPALGSTGTLVIAEDTVLTENHTGSIFIDADGVTLDCNGHEVTGPGVTGITLSGRTGATVKNCRVTGFAFGVALFSSTDNTLRSNTVTDNDAHGFFLISSHGNTLKFNAANNNGRVEHTFGFFLNFSNDNSLKSNVANNNGSNPSGANNDGFHLFHSHGNDLKDNIANGNSREGFGIAFSSDNAFRENTANGNGQYGFVLHPSSQNDLRRNTANGNGVDGFILVDSNRNIVRENVADDNARFGFSFQVDSDDNDVRANHSCGNGSVDAFQDGTSRNLFVANAFCTTSGIQ